MDCFLYCLTLSVLTPPSALSISSVGLRKENVRLWALNDVEYTSKTRFPLEGAKSRRAASREVLGKLLAEPILSNFAKVGYLLRHLLFSYNDKP